MEIDLLVQMNTVLYKFIFTPAIYNEDRDEETCYVPKRHKIKASRASLLDKDISLVTTVGEFYR